MDQSHVIVIVAKTNTKNTSNEGLYLIEFHYFFNLSVQKIILINYKIYIRFIHRRDETVAF